MNKLLTIPVLLLMLLLQYSRQASYLQCKLENIPVSATCDCEKIMQQNNEDHSDHPGHITKPAAPDEIFYAADILMMPLARPATIAAPAETTPHFHPQLFIQLPEQPPTV